MKALLLMPFAFAAGAEGFALFAPYLVAVLAVLHFARARRRQARPAPARFRLPSARAFDLLPDAQPAM
jgi:hypothetical protein